MGQDSTNHEQTRPKGRGLIFPLAVLAILGLYFALSPKETAANEIRVTADMAREIAAEREAVTGRQPSREELETLVRTYAEDEMLFLEAEARKIEHEGCPSRKHLINRLLFVLDESPKTPTKSDLHTFLAEHQGDYQVPERVSFEQVFFSKGKGTNSAEVLEELRNGANRKEFGTRYWMGNDMQHITRIEIETSMGSDFANATFSAPSGEWAGPFESSRGTHLIRVTDRREARTATFEEVSIQLEHDWDRQRRVTARERLMKEFQKSYTVEIDSLDGVL